MDKKIVITGAAGFIGSNVAKALSEKEGTEIIAVDYLVEKKKKKNLAGFKYNKYFEKDKFLDELQKNQIPNIDTIIHLGACTNTTVTDERYVLENNTEYSKKLFDYCVKNGIRLIYASSGATYGDGSNGYDDQKRLLKPLNLYGKSKYLFDEYVLDNKIKPKQWVGLKFFNVYGPNEFRKGEMASMVFQCYNQIKKTGEVMLFKSSRSDYKNGEEKRDFIYIKDVIKVILFFLDNNKISGIFNIGTGKARTFLDLATAVFKSLKIKPKISFFEMPKDIKNKYQYFTQADISSLRAAGYKEDFFELEEGIDDYIKNYLNNDSLEVNTQ